MEPTLIRRTARILAAFVVDMNEPELTIPFRN
jgi:hypothetical protein